ncbi:MAG TPA: nickel-binding protein [Candidatus Limnocylindrales bacterium]|nr:nickel-binding protein [Candidatus Limnocylindrales bacterium]
MDELEQPAAPATFLVERYWPGIDLARLRDVLPRLEAAARAMTAEGTPVEHVGSILMPIDEVVFSLIAADDEALVRRLNERADLPADRIAAAVALLTPASRTR